MHLRCFHIAESSPTCSDRSGPCMTVCWASFGWFPLRPQGSKPDRNTVKVQWPH
uniref:Uncharacterized protein n=1 Tax=Anguilla anguilla TaxID=7936 RepID=A0A0E9XU27_ANGAN